MEFRNCDSNADKVKLYESVRKSLAEICEDEPEAFSPASVSENSYKDLDDVNENESREYQVPVGIYMIKVNKKNTRTDAILVSNFEHISHLVLVFLLLTLNT